MVGRKTKVLYLSNSHPVLQPGGTGTYALELHEAMGRSDEFESLLVSRMGSSPETPVSHRAGAPFSALDGDPTQYTVLIEEAGFDPFYMTFGEKSLYTRYFADFLRTQEPDVVHFLHSPLMGCELISLIHRSLPAAPIVHTLHDYGPICHREGKLVRTRSEALCLKASSRRCHECFPAITEQEFFYRRRFIGAHLDHVDLFLAPSNFLLERYVEWGIARERIRFEDYGRPPAQPVPESTEDRPRNRLGFFGDVGPFKGTEVLFEAMRVLRDRQSDAHLSVYGSNLGSYPDEYQERLRTLKEAGNISFAGAYDRGSLAHVMSRVDWVVVPSRWWESSPLVIQEAFLHGRPVICSDIGGMAEKVANGVNGLHFTVGSPQSLADTMLRAVTTAGLWEELRAGAPPVPPMEEHVGRLTSLYRELLERENQVEAPAVLR